MTFKKQTREMKAEQMFTHKEANFVMEILIDNLLLFKASSNDYYGDQIEILTSATDKLNELFIEQLGEDYEQAEAEAEAEAEAKAEAEAEAEQESNPADVLWVANDGSWGSGEILVVDTNLWSAEQHKWFEKHLEENADEPDLDVVAEINKGVEPEWEE